MRLSKVLMPVGTAVAAIAVGAAATLFAVQFATPPSDVLLEPATETAPVVEPVGQGGSGATGDIFDVSGATANTEIAASETASDFDEVMQRLIDELTEADDPGDAAGASITVYDESSPDGSAASDDGDPCAPREGEAPEGCPGGLHSTVLALVAPENPFYVIAGSAPPSYDDSPYKLLYCDPQDHDELQLPIGISTNAPASITLRYWPAGDPTDVTEVNLETSAADRAAWESGLAAASGFTGRWARPQHCLVLEGLDKYTTYRAELDATDILGRTAHDDWGFMLPEDRTVPPTRVIPLSDNILFVSAPHIPQQDVEVRAWRVSPGVDASCANPEAQSAGLEELQEPRTTEVSAEFLAIHNYQPAYTNRTSAAYWVPEGSTILVCMRWLNPERPSWDWDASLSQYEQVLQSPDRTIPIVTLESVALARTVAADAIELRGRTREGQACGFWSGPEVDSDSVELSAEGEVLCHTSYYGASSRGDVVISSSVTQGDNETTQLSVLPLSRAVCRGTCVLPETSWYRLALPTLRVGTGLCGSSFGPCDPPTAEVAAGSALLRVDWSQGDTNGQRTWALGLASTGTPERVRADVPQMNTFKELTARPGALTGTYDIGFTLATDRPVTYTARLSGDCLGPGMQTVVSGSSAGITPVNFGRACLGGTYVASVELVDEAGNRSNWSPTAGPGFWPYGFVSAPLRDTNLTISYTITRPSSDFIMYVTPLSITVDGARMTPSPSQPCVAGNTVSVRDRVVRDLALGERITVEVTVAMHTAYGSASGSVADCDSSEYDGETLTFSTVVSRADLISVDGVTITAPAGSPYSVTIVIHGA